MHRTCRCFFVGPAFAVVALWCVATGSVHGQTSASSVPSAAPAAASSVPAANTAAVPSHHNTVRRYIHHHNSGYASEGVLSPSSYPGRLGYRMRLSDGKRIYRASRHELGVSYATGSDDSGYGDFTFSVDRSVLRSYLLQLAPFVHRSPVPAHPAVTNANNMSDDGSQPVPARIIPGWPGRALDVDGAEDAIADAIESNPSTVKVVMPVTMNPPKGNPSDLDGIDARIGYFITRFDPDDVGRTQTVRLAIKLIDGTILKPGQTFSVNRTVGERTAVRGFGQGHVFYNGAMVIQQGGGMCQVATTLFNAAMLADLQIVERDAHVRTVPYVEPGRDATVYWGRKDFKFRNDTQWPVYISYRTTYRHAIVALYGHGIPGRKVVLVDHSRRIAERHYSGVFYRIVTEPDGSTHRDQPFYSDYEWTPALDFSH